MNHTVEQMYRTIGLGLVACLSDGTWSKAQFRYLSISRYVESEGDYIDKAKGTQSIRGVPDEVRNGFRALRTEMAKFHDTGHAWYTAVFTLTPDGKFKFDFDYDRLPAFDIMPDPEDWLDEFKHYPRPDLQAQIQDWIDGTVPYEDYKLMVQRLRSFHEAGR